jgi:predicted nucleic acid-binding protein
VADAAAGVLYVDTSALVKLVVTEAESAALERDLDRWPDLATSEITAIELTRAVMRVRSDESAEVADDRTVLEVLAALSEVPLTDDVRAIASTLRPATLRTLDAIHLASALTLGDDLAGVLTYDTRMQEAATASQLLVVAPS